MRSYAERSAINAPMQGTAADIIKRAMIEVHRWLYGVAHARLMMQVHDELVLEVAEDRADAVLAELRGHMANAAVTPRAAEGRSRRRPELGRSSLKPCGHSEFSHLRARCCSRATTA